MKLISVLGRVDVLVHTLGYNGTFLTWFQFKLIVRISNILPFDHLVVYYFEALMNGKD